MGSRMETLFWTGDNPLMDQASELILYRTPRIGLHTLTGTRNWGGIGNGMN